MTPSELAAVREAAELERDVREAGGEPCRKVAERCKARSEWRYAAELADEAHAHRAALLQHIDSGWTPVSAGLPEKRDVPVLVTMNTGTVAIMHITKDGRHWYNSGLYFNLDWILAWRLLPEPYRPGGEG